MVDAPPDWAWGGWVLGDLADILRRACDVLGNATDIERVVVSPPSRPEEVPEIRVVVPSELGLLSIRRDLTQGEYPVQFFGRPTDNCWIAEVPGLRLFVAHAQGRSS
ncbi:hypothetical protein D0Z08_17445 [Nocardioides immobilis]|uniref:Uncharacterized protein n=1 Tax=Nocardioides immobilis TaxID=2049295 RepID=A0A417XZN8_9ACTN|nr:hypothetical protein [Nocardioides immobilis]RHW25821.1 hypothetical protein D0Z08_17445 [Nocardioides immobilis]